MALVASHDAFQHHTPTVHTTYAILDNGPTACQLGLAPEYTPHKSATQERGRASGAPKHQARLQLSVRVLHDIHPSTLQHVLQIDDNQDGLSVLSTPQPHARHKQDYHQRRILAQPAAWRSELLEGGTCERLRRTRDGRADGKQTRFEMAFVLPPRRLTEATQRNVNMQKGTCPSLDQLIAT